MPGHDAVARRVRAHLKTLTAAGLQRTLRPPRGIDLSSNDYLCLARDPRIAERLIEGVRQEGCGSTGSRLLRGERDIFASLERRFATFKGTDRALYFSSGYLANLAVLTTFLEEGDLVLSDSLNHASLIDGIRLSGARRIVFPHNDVEALSALLSEQGGASQTFVVVESLFSMNGDEPPLGRYAELCRNAGASLIVDEAHAVGIYGTRGSGLIEEHGINDDVLVSVNTAGKALGVSGAFVTGPEWAIEYLVQRARPFLFSTAAPPALAAALDASLDVIDAEPGRRAQLQHLARHLRQRLAEAGWATASDRSQIIPIRVGDNARAVALAEELQGAGFDVRTIRPPTVPEGSARLRVSVNIGVTEETLDRFAAALAAAMGQLSCSAASS